VPLKNDSIFARSGGAERTVPLLPLRQKVEGAPVFSTPCKNDVNVLLRFEGSAVGFLRGKGVLKTPFVGIRATEPGK